MNIPDEEVLDHIVSFSHSCDNGVHFFTFATVVSALESLQESHLFMLYGERHVAQLRRSSSISFPTLKRGLYDVSFFLYCLHYYAGGQRAPSIHAVRLYATRLRLSMLPAYPENDSLVPLGQPAELAYPAIKRRRNLSIKAIVAEHPDVVYDKFEALLQENALMKAAIADMRVNLEQAQQAVVTRGTTRNGNPAQLKAVADYKLWTSRNMGHGSAIALMSVMGVKGSHGLLYRSERRGGAAHNIVGKLRSERLAADIADVEAATIKQWVVIVIRTDAFSSSQARSQAHKLQVTVFVIGSSSSTISGKDVYWPDLLEVEFGTAQEFRSIVLTQLRMLGLPSWTDGNLEESCFYWWIIVGDDGPDVS